MSKIHARLAWTVAYRIARRAKRSYSSERKAIDYPRGKIYVFESHAVAMVDGRDMFEPGRFTPNFTVWQTRESRRYWLQRARDTGPVPLP